jgi:hypothetical protein
MKNQVCLYHCTVCGWVLRSDDSEDSPICCGEEMYLACIQSAVETRVDLEDRLFELSEMDYENWEKEHVEECRDMD